MTDYTADDLAVEIEQLLHLPEETVGTYGKDYLQLTIAQARALVDLATSTCRDESVE